MYPVSLSQRSATLAALSISLLFAAAQIHAEISYQRWLDTTSLPAGSADPLADPDNDSLANALEWYLGLNPLSADTSPLAAEQAGPETLITFKRGLNALDHTGHIESSNDGVIWAGVDATRHALPYSETHETIQYRITSNQLAPQQTLFRLKVTVPQEIALWRFEGSTSDDSGNGYDGILRSGAGVAEGKLSLDGENSYLEVPDGSSLRLDNGDGNAHAFTISGWVRLDENAHLDTEEHEYAVFQKGIWTRPPFIQLGLRGGAFRGLHARIYGEDLTSHAYVRAIPEKDISFLFPGQWRHIAFTRDESGTGRLYLDGNMVGENPFMSAPVDPPADAIPAEGAVSPLGKVWIGRNYSKKGAYFDGKLDEIRVHRRALSETEIQQSVVSHPPDDSWTGWGGYPRNESDNTIYVSPDGDDGNSGTRETPLASIGKALDLVHDPNESRLHIFVFHGVYHEGVNRFINPDSPLSNRQPGELVIAREGVTLEAQPAGPNPGQRVTIKGSTRKDLPSTHPLQSVFPDWQSQGGGLHWAERNGQPLNPQAIYYNGAPLQQSGDAWICSSLDTLMIRNKYIAGNDPANIPAMSFYSAEKLKLKVPEQGGAAILDGMRFSISRGNGTDVFFEFNKAGDYSLLPNTIEIPFSNGINSIGQQEGSADTQAELAAGIISALTGEEALPLGLNPVFDNGVIELGPRDRGDGSHMALATQLAAPLSCHQYDLYLKLPEGIDPNSPATNLEIPHSTQIMVVRAPHTKVKGFTMMYTNATASITATAVSIAADNVVFENNEVLWHDWGGIYFYARAVNGLRPPVRNVLLLNNRFSYCGNNGITHYLGAGCRMIGNDTSGNNWRNFIPNWHAGGFKFLGVLHDFTIIQHTCRHNQAYGMWFDGIDVRGRLFSGQSMDVDALGVDVSESVSEFNTHSGFFYEASVAGVFTDNVARYNGQRGFYLSNVVSCQFERNLAVGNGLEGFGVETNIRSLRRPIFNVPATHPLRDNWSNFLYFGAVGFAGNRISNNIIRNNSLVDSDHHDPWDSHLGNLPLHNSPNHPLVLLPKDSGGVDYAPAIANSVKNNECDHNILWKTGEPVYFGYSPTFQVNFALADPRTSIDGDLMDLKDVDFSLDGKADHNWNVLNLFPGGLPYNYILFPDFDAIGFGHSTIVEDRFEFIDPAELSSPPPNSDEVIHPDLDGDGLYDWWEASHGLNPLDNSGMNGGNGDPDQDGLTNSEEFQNWKNGTAFSDLTVFLQASDPTLGSDNRNGTPRDLDGDRLPDLWENWFGLDPGNGGDGAAYLEAFLRSEIPLPLADDSDNDNLPDDWERTAFQDLSESGEGDFDADGFTNMEEFRYWTLPFDSSDPIDADNDGLPDDWEKKFGFSRLPSDQTGATGDPDGDGQANIDEFRNMTNPRE